MSGNYHMESRARVSTINKSPTYVERLHANYQVLFISTF